MGTKIPEIGEKVDYTLPYGRHNQNGFCIDGQ